MGGFAYVVMAHTGPDDVLRHVRRIRSLSPNAGVLLRSAAGSEVADLPVAAVTGAGATPFTSGIAVRWGDWSLTAAALESLARARRLWDPDHTVLVSGQDHPVRDLGPWETELTAAGSDAVLRADERDYSYRWRHCWHTLPGAGPAAGRLLQPAAAAARRAHLPVQLARAGGSTWMWHHARGADPRHAGPPLPYRKGSFWCVLSRAAVAVLLDAAARPDVGGYFRSTLLPDEAFAHSVLAASGLRLTPGATSFTVFPPEDLAHPRPLGPGDVEAARRSGAPFARKVVLTGDDGGRAFADAVDALVDAGRATAVGCPGDPGGQGQSTS